MKVEKQNALTDKSVRASRSGPGVHVQSNMRKSLSLDPAHPPGLTVPICVRVIWIERLATQLLLIIRTRNFRML
ncbi:protein of unknown function [Candidatus Filomicrobium marinum]|nr:protein of unknown function [Candidatus Filomicrobium marinum]